MKGIDRVSAIDNSAPRMLEHVPDLPIQIISLIRLMRASNVALSTYLDPLMRPLSFTESSLHTLVLLFSSEQGTATPGLLCDLVGQTRANMTRILDDLIAKSYVSRSTDGGDGRRRIIRITAEGRRFVRTALPTLSAPLRLAVAELKPAEIRQLDKLLRQLVSSLDRGERKMRTGL